MMTRVSIYLYLAFTKLDVIDPCTNSNVLDNERRDVSCAYKQDQLCDDLISTAWYRIDGSAVTTCPEISSCGSLYPIWLNGTLPQVTGDTVTRTMCTKGSLSCCDHAYEIKIKMCPDFYAFCLPSVSSCPSRYCFTGNPCSTSTTSHTDLATSGEKFSTTVNLFESTTSSFMKTSYVTWGNLTGSVEDSTTSPTVKNKEDEGTSEYDTWKFVAFGSIGVLVLAALIFGIVFVMMRRRSDKQTKSTKNDSIKDIGNFEKEEHYDEIGHVRNSTLERQTENGDAYSTIDGDTNVALNQTFSNMINRGDNGAGTNRSFNNMLMQSSQNTRQTDTTSYLKKEPSAGIDGQRKSRDYDDCKIDTNDSVYLKATNNSSSQVEKEYEPNHYQYQTLKEHGQYEGMGDEHTYQHIKKDHQYESLSKEK